MGQQTIRQSIRYVRGSDGVRLAWASAGSGPPLVKAANWLTHLQYDLESPVWRHWIEFFAEHFHFIRYDERGCGMSQWEVPEVSLPRWVDDLSAVIDAAQCNAPMTLLGISQGASACIAYAVRHPERVSHLILYGGYATGWAKRGDPQGLRRFQAIVELIRLGWGTDTVAFRQVFTSRFAPGASQQQLEWFNELCRRTTTPDIAAHLMLARSEVDVRELLPQLQVPTLVIHPVDDQVTPLNASRELASEIANAEFVQLESRNHVLLEHEPAWAQFKETVLEFTGRGSIKAAAVDRFGELSPRERDVLGGLAAGHTNAQIATSLHLSEKTVRNIVSRIFAKLDVESRTQAAVLARDNDFKA
ncbi:alpha/beta fold hydrolase [Steroidobacter cummioxidans]|uniref:alpha/beta fold hydrolase n=1 Tax=Steroidobacter cummioxidans TaxID=1803913 RepID=UPI000E31328C|nr:alpha/beta fold hydrolase [Steroidobacter cummioxidans]